MVKWIIVLAIVVVALAEEQKLQWKEDDGLEIKIIRPIKAEKCKLKSQEGDTLEQFYRLADKDGNEIGSNFGKKPYSFTLGKGQVIPGMERAMTGMCIGEKRKVVIPGNLGFGDKGPITLQAIRPYTTQFNLSIFSALTQETNGLMRTVTHQIPESECRKSEPGDTIHQQYTLHLEDGTFVDSSWSRNAPFIFRLGQNEVIAGMDRAMTNMCEGERRKLVIPYELGYGEEGRPPQIPPKSRLYFDIQLEKLIKRDEL